LETWLKHLSKIIKSEKQKKIWCKITMAKRSHLSMVQT
jgi:hypothetical protein